MKRLCIFTFVIVLAISLSACGRKGTDGTSLPSTDMTILPNMDPTIDTNIPDPSVDTSMPIYTEDFGTTEATDTANSRHNTK